jgi:hypothetical protein
VAFFGSFGAELGWELAAGELNAIEKLERLVFSRSVEIGCYPSFFAWKFDWSSLYEAIGNIASLKNINCKIS